jgi:hypothetical protein
MLKRCPPSATQMELWTPPSRRPSHTERVSAISTRQADSLSASPPETPISSAELMPGTTPLSPAGQDLAGGRTEFEFLPGRQKRRQEADLCDSRPGVGKVSLRWTSGLHHRRRLPDRRDSLPHHQSQRNFVNPLPILSVPKSVGLVVCGARSLTRPRGA